MTPTETITILRQFNARLSGPQRPAQEVEDGTK